MPAFPNDRGEVLYATSEKTRFYGEDCIPRNMKLDSTSWLLLRAPQTQQMPLRPSAACEEIEALQHELHVSQEEAKKWAAEVEKAVRSNDMLEEKLRRMQDHLNEREEKLRGVQDGFQRANDTIRCLQQELAETRKALRDEYQRHDQTVNIHERALATLTDKHTKMTTLLEVRTAELQATKTYLTKVDNISDADLLSMVGELNSQIYQLAAQMSDKISFSSCPTNQLALPLELAQAVEHSIGPAILHLLLIRGHSEDAICVQIALQACIVNFAHRIIETWDFETDAANDLLRRAYDSLKITENSAVSGRWRALTKATLRSLTQVDSFKSRLRDAMAKVIVDVVRVAGVSAVLSPEELSQSIRADFREQLSAIIDTICSVHKVLGEDFISSHIASIFYPFGHTFDANCMEEAYPSGDQSDEQAYNAHPLSIFGTVEMGVQRIEMNDPGAGRAGQLHCVTLLKPKVVVETLIDEVRR